MCQRVQCSSCEKPSYAGCGRHIEQVLGDVPREARCRCRETRSDGKQEPSFFSRIFGKS